MVSLSGGSKKSTGLWERTSIAEAVRKRRERRKGEDEERERMQEREDGEQRERM